MSATWISKAVLGVILPGLLLAVDPAALLQRADEVDRQHEELRRSYVYRELQINWNNMEGTGKSRSGLFENLFVEGLRYRKRLERNGKPLSSKEQKEVEAAMQRTAEERRAERKKVGRGLFSRVYNFRYGYVGEVAGVSDCSVAGEEAGSWVIRCEPKAGFVATTKAEQELLCYRQTFWVDQKDMALAGRRAEVIRNGADLKPGSVMDERRTREEGDGPWLARKMWIRFEAPRGKGYQAHEFSDYRRFAVESTITVDGQPGVPPGRP